MQLNFKLKFFRKRRRSTHLSVLECVRLLDQLRDPGRLPGQRRDPPEHRDRGDAQRPRPRDQPPVPLLIPRHLHTPHRGQRSKVLNIILLRT